MDIKDLQQLVEQFDNSSIREFDLHKGDFSFYLSKNENNNVHYTPIAPAQAFAEPVALAPAPTTAPVAPGAEAAPVEETSVTSVAAEGEVIESPIVGTVYLQPSPDKPAYVKVGDTVEAHDTICIVEAMKMMNEIPAGVDGTITEILVENEQVIGIGDPLFRIK